MAVVFIRQEAFDFDSVQAAVVVVSPTMICSIIPNPPTPPRIKYFELVYLLLPTHHAVSHEKV